MKIETVDITNDEDQTLYCKVRYPDRFTYSGCPKTCEYLFGSKKEGYLCTNPRYNKQEIFPNALL